MKPFANAAAIAELRDTVAAKPELGKLTLQLKSQSNGGVGVKTTTGLTLQNGVADDGRVGKFTTIGDEPAALGGSDKGLSPLEYILQGLAGCYTATLTILAAQKGIELDDIRIDLAVDTDLNGFLKLNPDVRNGASEIRADIHLESPTASRAELDALIAEIPNYSPIYDLIRNPTPVVNRPV
ncbi:osmotically inducible protein C [Neisseria chenwenguii]|uniref:Osmotically inducible protein C n=1 Tax=Neisseria chenwenguii TaxID=1853278 RepID=A0A220S1X4_9NEIS|nr:OsmC family protein [Neisseria chenwenguii]ASK27358.1 osmotically inducible protein C [Neisseria chenwenguii]